MTSLAARGDNLIAGDAISSVSIVKVKENNLELVARNYGPLWPIAVEGGRDQGVIGANVSGFKKNLYAACQRNYCSVRL